MTDDLKFRAYDSPIRRQHAELTRQRIAEAARALFLDRGYANTSLREVAKAAGVSEQTIYATYGSNTALVLAMIDAADLRAGSAEVFARMEEADGEPARQLQIMVAFDRRLFGDNGDVLSILRDTGKREPDLAKGYHEARERAQQMHLSVMQRWEELGQLRDGQDPERASDLYHGVSCLESYEYLVHERGWTPDDWQSSVESILRSALLNG